MQVSFLPTWRVLLAASLPIQLFFRPVEKKTTPPFPDAKKIRTIVSRKRKTTSAFLPDVCGQAGWGCPAPRGAGTRWGRAGQPARAPRAPAPPSPAAAAWRPAGHGAGWSCWVGRVRISTQGIKLVLVFAQEPCRRVVQTPPPYRVQTPPSGLGGGGPGTPQWNQKNFLPHRFSLADLCFYHPFLSIW